MNLQRALKDLIYRVFGRPTITVTYATVRYEVLPHDLAPWTQGRQGWLCGN